MAPKIYTSPKAPVPVYDYSVFTHLFKSPSNDPTNIGGYPGHMEAFTDAETGTSLTRAQVKQLALQFGYGIRYHARTPVQRGDVVMVFSPNSLNWPVVLFGSIAAGLRCTLANSAYTPKELAFQYTDSGAKLVFVFEELITTALEMFLSIGVSKEEAEKRIVVLESGFDWAGGPASPRRKEAAGLLRLHELLNKGTLLGEERFDGTGSKETVYLCYSSGTTGKPKGVETTHQNVTTLVDIVGTTFPPSKPGAERLLGILPFYHIYGAIKLLHFPFVFGIPVVIQSGFNPIKFCEAVEKYKIHSALIVPPVLVVLSRHPAVDQYDFSSLSFLFSGAAPLGASLVKAVSDRLKTRKKNGEIRVMQGYGLTETSPTTHLLPYENALSKVGSIGILLPTLEARLVVDGEGDGQIDAKEGEPGELWVRGPTIMKGYLNNVAATKDAITHDKWFKTGDIAVRDKDGYYTIVDRRKELIKYKGFQVPPAELESVLLTHPDIADTAVIGVDSAKEATELPRAYVVHTRPDEVKDPKAKAAFEGSVQDWIKAKVARHKFLRGGVVVIDIIPKSAAGKILRRELRERAKTELAGRDPSDAIVKAKL